MKHPFYKSLAIAGALAATAVFVACSDDSSTSGIKESLAESVQTQVHQQLYLIALEQWLHP